MSEEKKQTRQPVIPQSGKGDELRKIFQRHFPGVLQPKAGGFVVDQTRLQGMLSPKNWEVVNEGFELRWVGKKEAFHNAYAPNDKILKPLRAESAGFDNTGNILIKGDNLDALKLLRLNYFERVKVIYIDPPYNTKSGEFVYNDNYTQSQEKVLDELGYGPEQKEHVKNIAGAATHSGWLNFMYPRLLLAKDLLAADGVIFISIDDNEMAALKMLCDEIFGESNFVNTIIWQRASGGGAAKGIVTGHDYILVYQKDINPILDYRGEEIGNGRFSKDKILEKDGRTFFVDDDVVRKKFGRYEKGVERRCYYEELEKYKNPEQVREIQDRIDAGEYILRRQKNGMHFIAELVEKGSRKKMYSIIQGVLNNHGQEDLEKLDFSVFDYPKPVELMERILSSIGNKDGFVLDFFAGSATTGHAVMRLNAADGGGRKFILVQLPEMIDPKTNKTARDFVQNELGKEPTIFEIAAERLRRAGKQVREEWKSKNGNLAGGKEPPDTGFRVFEIAEDAGNEMYVRPLGEVGQDDIAKLELDSPHDDDTLLCNLMLGEGIPLDAAVKTHIAGALYEAGGVLFVLGEFSPKEKYRLLQESRINRVCVYDARIKSDRFILELQANVAGKNKVAVKGRTR